MATLLFDLLTEEEETIDQRTRHLRFDITTLLRQATPLDEIMDQLQQVEQPKVHNSPEQIRYPQATTA